MELTIRLLTSHIPRIHGYALVDPTSAGQIGLKDGDCVKISTGDNSTISRIELDDSGETVAEGFLGVNIGHLEELQSPPDESVEVEKVESSIAESVHIADLQDRGFQGRFDYTIRERLKGRCVTQGQETYFTVNQTSGGGGHKVPIRIMDTEPSGVVSISVESELKITPPPAEVEGGSVVSLDNELMEILDEFVKQSGYDSKTEFLNEIIRERLEDEGPS